MILAPRHDFVVALRQDIMAYINENYSGGGSGPVVQEEDLGRIITELGTGEEDELEAEEKTAEPEID